MLEKKLQKGTPSKAKWSFMSFSPNSLSYSSYTSAVRCKIKEWRNAIGPFLGLLHNFRTLRNRASLGTSLAALEKAWGKP